MATAKDATAPRPDSGVTSIGAGARLALACRFCGTPADHLFVDLGMSPLCESYLTAAQLNQMEPFYPLPGAAGRVREPGGHLH